MPDVIAVFKAEQTAKTRERVINWMFPIYDEYSEIPVEKVWSRSEVNEEFQIPMPTIDAFCSEVQLCNAILEHAAGQMSDTVMQSTLREFLDTHIWVYHPDGPRTNKKGRWGNFTRGVPLYRICFFRPLSGLKKELGDAEYVEIVVNAIQAWLIRLCEERRGAQNFTLHRM
jgi:hypothetical protein